MSDTEITTFDHSPQTLIPFVNSLLHKLQSLDPSTSMPESVYGNFKKGIQELENSLDFRENENKEISEPSRKSSVGDEDNSGAEKRSAPGNFIGGYAQLKTPLSPAKKKKGKYVFLDEEPEESQISQSGNAIRMKNLSINHRAPEPNSDPHAYDLDTYFALSNKDILKTRLPWLVGLLILQSFSANILGAFDEMLDEHLIIAFFIPMLVGSGGNAGNQPGVMVTRALASGDLRNRSILMQLLHKECMLALVTASMIGFIGFIRVLMQDYPGVLPALSIGMSLWIVVFVSIFLGIGFSVTLDRFGVDPAAGSAPLLTTISDLVGISILCLVSYIILV